MSRLHTSRPRQELDCPLYFSWAAQPQHHEMCVFRLYQPLRGFAAAAVPGAPGPTDRVAGPQQMPPLLAVAGPQLGPQNGAGQRPGDHPSHDHRAFIIEPDEMGRSPPDYITHRAVLPSTTQASALIASATRRTNSSGSCRVRSRHPDCQLIASSSICGGSDSAAMLRASVVLPAPAVLVPSRRSAVGSRGTVARPRRPARCPVRRGRPRPDLRGGTFRRRQHDRGRHRGGRRRHSLSDPHQPVRRR